MSSSDFEDLPSRLTPEAEARIEALMNDPEFQPDPEEFDRGLDPLGMNWSWADPPSTAPPPAELQVERPAVTLNHWRRPVAFALASAASLLIGLALGRSLFQSSPVDNQILLAQAATRYAPPRGGGGDLDVLQTRVDSTLPGFLTIVSLSADRRPLTSPQETTRLSPDAPSEWVDIPDDTKRFIAVVTETPSIEVIRARIREAPFRDLGPADLDRARTELVAFLHDMGYRRIAVGSADVTDVRPN